MNHPVSVYAPGRAELLGNHTDYNEGTVLSIAIDYGTRVEGVRLEGSDTFHITSTDPADEAVLNLKTLAPSTEKPWTNYVAGVAARLLELGIPLGGCRLTISRTLPLGAGLSSSAALECATLLCLQKLYPFEMEVMEMAQAAQAAENHFAGMPCGLLDQASSLASRKNHVTHLDCRSLDVSHTPVPGDVVFFIVHSGAKHALVDGEYAARRASCEEAAKALGVDALRDASPEKLDEARSSLDPTAYKRAHHIVHECRRVEQACEALRSGDSALAGKLMFESHESSRTMFENSCAELDTVVEIAHSAPGCLGARLSGGGFGGATIQLVRRDQADAFETHTRPEFEKHFGKAPLILRTCAASGGIEAQKT